jgi:voltage-gated potassium channel
MLTVAWEIFVLGVAVLSITNLFLMIFISDPHIQQIITIVDSILILIFLIDFLRRVRVADDARKYVVKGWGWLDLISIIPMLRIARILRIVRVMRVLQRMGGPSAAMQAFFASRATGGLLLVFLIAILVLEFGGIAVLFTEKDAADATILTAGDAIWYIIVTMSTVGYGDIYPVTDLGRLFGVVIIVVGVGVFGTLTGFLANAFMAPADEAGEAPEDTEPASVADQAGVAPDDVAAPA